MEDLATTPFETPAQEWQWMEASVQDEVSVRAVEEAARAHAEQAQAQAEEEARLAAAARSEAEDASERDQRARLVAEASEKAAKEETETWWVKPLSLPCRKQTALSLTMACCLDRRSTAMAAEVAVAETLEM